MRCPGDYAPVLISDIDRGGCLHMLPAHWPCHRAQRRLIQAVVVNRFRGFPGKLQPGLELLEESINKPVIGVIPTIPQPLQAADPAQREKREQVYRLLAQYAKCRSGIYSTAARRGDSKSCEGRR